LRVGEGKAVAKRGELVCPRPLHFNREADEVSLRLIDVKSKQAHPLAPPDLHRKTIFRIAAEKLAHTQPMMNLRREQINEGILPANRLTAPANRLAGSDACVRI
jgi:hypothetical protein